MELRFFWYIFPILVLFATRFAITRFSIFKKYAIKSVDLATFFLIIGLHELSMETYSGSIFPFWLIVVMLLGIVLAVFFAYYYGEVDYHRFFKMFWRLTFLLTIILYLVFIVLNILSQL